MAIYESFDLDAIFSFDMVFSEWHMSALGNAGSKFLDSLKRALRKQKTLSIFDDNIQQAYATRWVVHYEPSLHRVAITNPRILNITDGKVTFIAKDYRDRAIKKPVTLDGLSSCDALQCISCQNDL